MFSESSENFIFNSNVGIHAVSPEGIIVYANQCELETLGYDHDEYVGHHVSKFQLDKTALADMMNRLANMEILKNYPSRVQGKYDIFYMLYNSNVYIENDAFIHTRYYATPVDEMIYNAFVEVSPYYSKR